ncbi:hypothetical protein [Halomonas aquatica]|uniref:Uncharacterized protein n=1 Tax=Halomonas aquatica TaxID=3151123 RepID=A0ABV1NI51_9GAMM
MNIKLLTLIVSITFASSAIANPNLEFSERGDDFSNKVISTLRVSTSDTSAASLYLSCNPAEGLSVQLATRDVMFPDDLPDNYMRISTTHKFEEAPKADTTYWMMNMMKYKNSWYRGNQRAFIEQAARSSQLNLRLNRQGTVYRFDLNGATPPLKKILERC